MGRKEMDPRVIASLQQYPWPGNIRELRNFIERLIIMTPGQTIGLGDLPRDFQTQASDHPEKDGDPYREPTLKKARACFEREYLLRKLEEFSWNVSLTATRIGIERSHLHRKLKTLEIKGDEDSEMAGCDMDGS
jgi:two-component system nitrogen regulation response regulator NtrX